jgi:hypothetical protein
MSVISTSRAGDFHARNLRETYPAGETISALKVVRGAADGKVYLCRLLAADCNMALGLSVTSGLVDAPISVLISGIYSDGSWDWALDKPVFVGVDGALTQTASATAYNQIVATPITKTSLELCFQQAIKV